MLKHINNDKKFHLNDSKAHTGMAVGAQIYFLFGFIVQIIQI